MQKTEGDATQKKTEKITEQEREAFIRAIQDPKTREKIIAILIAGGLLP